MPVFFAVINVFLAPLLLLINPLVLTMAPLHTALVVAVVVAGRTRCSADAPIPAGWYPDGASGTRQECLDHIARVWTDLRPRSLRDNHLST